MTIVDPSASRATQRFEKKREAILDGATHLLNQAGVRCLTLAEAAAKVGLSTTSVTYYFKRKEDLAAAVLLRGIETMTANAEAALASPTPETRLQRLVELHFERLRQAAAGEAPPLPSLAETRALNPPRRAEVIGAFMGLFRKTRQLFDAPELAGLSRGRRSARTHMLLEQLFWAQAWLQWFGPDAYPRLAGQVLDVLIGGLAPEGAVWAPQPIPLSHLAGHEPREMSRDAFLLAATRLINARGYRGASVDLISAELNVTKGSFYHHIEAKDDLVVACFERTFDVMRRAQRMAAQGSNDRWTTLVNAAATLAEFQLSEHGPLLRSSAWAALPEPMLVRMIGEANKVSARFANMISEGIAEGSIRPVDPGIAALMLNATLNAAADLGVWVPGVKQKAAPAVFVRPLLMGVFETGARRA